MKALVLIKINKIKQGKLKLIFFSVKLKEITLLMRAKMYEIIL